MKTTVLFLLFLLCALPAGADELTDLQADNQLLQDELRLARNPKLYIIIDLRQQQCLFKASGVTVRQLSILQGSIHGALPEMQVRKLTAKKSFLAPKRPAVQIIDKSKKPDTLPAGDSLNALEITDMPGNYRLIFDDGTRILVRAETSGFWSTISRWASDMAGNIIRVFQMLWRALFGKTYTEVVLTLSLQDARQLYWSFDEGAPCLIRNPGTTR